MPFLPLVLFLAWQAVGRSASFALGWATALFFGRIPGNEGRILSVIALACAGWLVVTIGVGLPLVVGFALDALGVIDRSFSLPAWQAWGLLAVVVLGPPVIAAGAVWAGFAEDRSIGRWLRLVPISYPVSASLGLAVVQMVLVTPFLTLQRLQRRRVLLQVPFVLRERGNAEEVAKAIADALHDAELGDFSRQELSGPISWPLRTMGFAARHLLGNVVHGDPTLVRGDGLEIVIYATNVAIRGPEAEAHRARAAIHRRLALAGAYLTWDADGQQLEDRLAELRACAAELDGDGDKDGRGALLAPSERRPPADGPRDPGELADAVQALREEIDHASLTSDEWNLLERLRLQILRDVEGELAVHAGGPDHAARNDAPEGGG